MQICKKLVSRRGAEAQRGRELKKFKFSNGFFLRYYDNDSHYFMAMVSSVIQSEVI